MSKRYTIATRAIELISRNGRPLFCAYCGTETPSIGGSGMCANCELPLSASMDAVRASKPTQFSYASQISSKTSAGDYDGASKLCDAAYSDTKDSGYMYTKGIIYTKWSNDEAARISYDRSGFMEENTVHRSKATGFAAQARAAFAYVISQAAHSDSSTSADPYLIFLCQLKLHNLREAAEELKIIKKSGKPMQEAYAMMMLELNTGNPEAALKASDLLLKPDLFSINALYYVAEALADKKDYNTSRKLALELMGKLPKAKLKSLIWRIDKASTI